jgi:hypothetical protein
MPEKRFTDRKGVVAKPPPCGKILLKQLVFKNRKIPVAEN